MNCFSSSPSVIESPLSRLLFRFVEVFISSCGVFVSFVFFFFLFSVFIIEFTFFPVFVLEFSGGGGFSSPSSVLLFSPVLAGDDLGIFEGDFLPCVTWVHPSSSLLLGWSPVSVGCVFEVTGILVFGVLFVVVVTVVDADDVITVALADFVGRI